MIATRTAGWTELLAAALAHDINNIALSLSSAQRLTRLGAGEDFAGAEWAAFVEGDVDRLRKLGVRLRALGAAEVHSSARLDDACADALVEVDPAGGQVRRADSSPGAKVSPMTSRISGWPIPLILNSRSILLGP